MAREQARCKTSEWLYRRGCAHDAVAQPAREPDPVDIRIDPTPMHSFLFRIAPGQPAFLLWAQFSARHASIHIAEVCFELCDAPNIRFELLPCPGSRRDLYCFPGGAFEIPQQQVANSFFPGILRRHHPVEGYIMGVAYQLLPERLLGMVAAELSAVDEFGDIVGTTQLHIPLDPNEHGKRYTSGKGKGAFEPLDDSGEPISSEVLLRRKRPMVPKTGPLISATKTARQLSQDGSEEMEPGKTD